MVCYAFRVFVATIAAIFMATSSAFTADQKIDVRSLTVFTSPNLVAPSAAPKTIMVEYGKSLPPIGYVQFCARSQDECKAGGAKAKRIVLSNKEWNQINHVNQFVNTSIKPTSDIDLYHVAEYWAYPTTTGDCEDYVLLKKRLLTKLGFAPSDLLITVLLDEHGEGHAVLTILTQNMDLILDNRRNEVLSANQTAYKFLKRQSQTDPKVWISLKKTETQVLVSSQAN